MTLKPTKGIKDMTLEFVSPSELLVLIPKDWDKPTGGNPPQKSHCIPRGSAVVAKEMLMPAVNKTTVWTVDFDEKEITEKNQYPDRLLKISNRAFKQSPTIFRILVTTEELSTKFLIVATLITKASPTDAQAFWSTRELGAAMKLYPENKELLEKWLA
jgi:hypothetical protein